MSSEGIVYDPKKTNGKMYSGSSSKCPFLDSNHPDLKYEMKGFLYPQKGPYVGKIQFLCISFRRLTDKNVFHRDECSYNRKQD